MAAIGRGTTQRHASIALELQRTGTQRSGNAKRRRTTNRRGDSNATLPQCGFSQCKAALSATTSQSWLHSQGRFGMNWCSANRA